MELSSAGGVFEPPAVKEWSAARLRVRLPGLDSSNSWRIAFKSSVAEMIGKSRNSKQESARAAWSDLKRSCRSQKQKAIGISSSQHRLSSSSTIYTRARKRLGANHNMRTDTLIGLPRRQPAYGVISKTTPIHLAPEPQLLVVP